MELVKGYSQTFINRFDAYPKQRIGKRSYDTIYQPLTTHLLYEHLLGGKVTLGAYALSPTSKAKWVALDADNDEDWQVFIQMSLDLETKGIRTRLEQSRIGGHLWFFTPEILGSVAHQFGKQLVFEYGLPEKQTEVFPKQERLRENGVGSFVRLPLGVHQASGKRYYFVTHEGQPLAPTIREQIALMISPPLVPIEFISLVVERYQERVQAERPRPTRRQKKYSPISFLS